VLVSRARDSCDVFGKLEHRVLKTAAGAHKHGVVLARVADSF